MVNYVLTCCSTADMPYDYFKSRNIPVVYFHFVLDGEEYPDDLGQTVSFEDFYRRIVAYNLTGECGTVYRFFPTLLTSRTRHSPYFFFFRFIRVL